jgi:glucose dehydrogenase
VALAVTVALAGCGSSSSKSGSSTSSSSHAAAVGQAPPEWAANAGAWPAHNHDLANTRATTQTPINSKTVSKLKVKWTFKFPYIGQFGAYTSNPIVLNGVVYIEGSDSNVYALNRETGAVMWKHLYKSVTPSGGRMASPSATGCSSARRKGPRSPSTRATASRSGSTS